MEQRTPGRLFVMVDIVTLVVEFAVYFVSLAGPAGLLWQWRHAHPLWLLALALLGFLLAGLVFALVLVALKRLLAGKVPIGRFFLTSPKILPWIVADRLVKIMIRSPFQALINEYSFYRMLFYRGMGARIDTTFLMGNGAKLPEPWAVQVGGHVHLGDDAVISGHKVEHNIVTLDQVEIGDNVLIGARSVVFPGVRIGNGALIGANSVVTRGSVIGDGETWSGIPARPVELFPGLGKNKDKPV